MADAAKGTINIPNATGAGTEFTVQLTSPGPMRVDSKFVVSIHNPSAGASALTVTRKYKTTPVATERTFDLNDALAVPNDSSRGFILTGWGFGTPVLSITNDVLTSGGAKLVEYEIKKLG